MGKIGVYHEGVDGVETAVRCLQTHEEGNEA